MELKYTSRELKPLKKKENTLWKAQKSSVNKSLNSTDFLQRHVVLTNTIRELVTFLSFPALFYFRQISLFFLLNLVAPLDILSQLCSPIRSLMLMPFKISSAFWRTRSVNYKAALLVCVTFSKK